MALWAAPVAVYTLDLTGIRLDSTTSAGYQEVTEEGGLPFGPSQDHRPDVPQLNLMAAASGHLLACAVEPGPCADDPLYTPLIRRVRQIVGRTGWLAAGDGKMAALSTRAALAAYGDDQVMPWPLRGDTAAQFERWVDAIMDGLPAAVARVLARHHGAALLTVTWARHEPTATRDVGRGRRGPDRPTRTAVQGR